LRRRFQAARAGSLFLYPRYMVRTLAADAASLPEVPWNSLFIALSDGNVMVR
jgi:hypothetical protein